MFLLQSINGFGQTDMVAASRLINSADSVILISHVSIEEHHDKRDIVYQSGDSAKPVELPSFFVGTGINPIIIVQRQHLSKQDILTLSSIIQKPVKKTRFGSMPLCFEPHHAMLIYKKGHLSYIDFCFDCSQLKTSSDIKLNNMDFRDGKWKDMKSFFVKHGLTYEMEEDN